MSPLANSIGDLLRAKPRHFAEVVDAYRAVSWPEFLRAWGELRQTSLLGRDEDGKYLVVSESGTQRE